MEKVFAEMAILLLQVLVLSLCNSSKQGKLRKGGELWPHPFPPPKVGKEGSLEGASTRLPALSQRILEQDWVHKEEMCSGYPTTALGLTAAKRMLAQEGGSSENSPGTWPF